MYLKDYRIFLLVGSLLFHLQTSAQESAQACKDQFRIILQEARSSQPVERLDSLLTSCSDLLLSEDQDTLALIHHMKGVFLNRAQQYEDAIQANQAALKIRENNPRPNLEKIGHSHFNLANCYRKMFRYSQAKYHLSIAIDTLIQQDFHRRTGEAYMEMGYCLQLTNDFHSALEYAIKSLVYFEKSPPSARIQRNIGNSYVLLGNLYSDLHRLDSSAHYRQKALALFQSSSNQTVLSQINQAKCYYNLAELSYKASDWNEALALCQQAEAVLTDPSVIPYFESKETLATVYSTMAVIRTKQGDYVQAHTLLDQSDGIRKELYPSLIHPNFCQIYDNRGDIYLRQNQIELALEQYQLAIQQLVPSFIPQHMLENPHIEDTTFIYGSKSDLLTYFRSKAKVLQRLAQDQSTSDPYLQSALVLYQEADRLIHRMKREHLHDGSKLFWIGQSRPIYEEAIQLCYELGNKEQAYEFAEKSMASLLLSEISNLNAKAQTGISEDLLREERDLKEDLRAAEIQLEQAKLNGDTATVITALQQSLIDIQIQFQRFVSDLEQDFPAYFQHKYQSTVVSIEDVQAHLRDQTEPSGFLQYFAGDSALYLFYLLENEAYLWRMDHSRGTFQSFFRAISDTLDLSYPSNREHFSLIAYELYRALLSPIRENELSLPYKLTIIPDGYTAQIPFEALLTRSKIMEDQPLPFFLRDHVIRYGFSASMLLAPRYYRKPATQGVLAIAPFKFETSAYFQPLLYSKVEAKNIIKTVGGKLLNDQQATKVNVLEQLPHYKILHFSTHAVSGKTPFIVLRDTFLFLPEIYSLQTSADMVSLSACETLQGDLLKGEGFMSLARAFQFIGVPSITASLWNVSDQTTQIIMNEYYQGLAKGLSKDVALHEAKVAYLDKADLSAQSAFYWAPFLLVGDDQALILEETDLPYKGWRLALIGVVIVILFVFWRRNRKKNHKLSAN